MIATESPVRRGFFVPVIIGFFVVKPLMYLFFQYWRCLFIGKYNLGNGVWIVYNVCGLNFSLSILDGYGYLQ